MAYDKAKRQRERRIEQKLKPSVKPLLKPIEALKIPEIPPTIKTNRPDMRTFQKFPLPPGSPAPLKQAIQNMKQNSGIPQFNSYLSPEAEKIELEQKIKQCPTCKGRCHIPVKGNLWDECPDCAPLLKRLDQVRHNLREKQLEEEARIKGAERGYVRNLPILDPLPED